MQIKKMSDRTDLTDRAAAQETKDAIRRLYRTRRNIMPPGQAAVLSALICRNILRSRLFESARFLYAYYPLGNEADIRPVVREAWRQRKQTAFPKVFGDEMRYFEVSGFEQLSEGTFGVMEPCEDRPADWCSVPDTLVLTPGVAFDRFGNRMGFGKGYYDRHFSGENGCVMLGVCYELQMAVRLPTEDWDVLLPWIVTENQITEVHNG